MKSIATLSLSALSVVCVVIGGCDGAAAEGGEGEGEDENGDCIAFTLGTAIDDLSSEGLVVYGVATGSDIDGDGADFLQWQFPRDRPTATGTFTLGTGENADLETCTECLVLATNFDVDALDPRVRYFQTAGSITLDADPASGRLSATIADVVLREYELRGGDDRVTFVDDGGCYRIDAATVDAEADLR